MLQEFKVRNYKNFRDEITFSLKTEKNYEYNNALIKDGLIKDCLIIGENATGKTNLGYAMLDIINHLTDKANKKSLFFPNLFSNDDIVYFEYTFRFGQSILIYNYEKKRPDSVIREKLVIDGKKVILSDSSEGMVDLKGAENLNLSNWDDTISLVKYVYANTVLDKADKYCRVFQQFMRFVNGMLWFSSTEGNRYAGVANAQGKNLYEAIAEKENGVDKLEQFLNEMGIHYHLVTKDTGEGLNIYCKMGKKAVPLSTLVSSGTRSLIFFFFWYLQMEEVSFLYIDEFDAFYHTDLSVAVVRKIIDINAQAIITSHNTDLLSSGLLRPDCIFKLTDNRIKSFSELTDKALREAHNLQKMYKAGAFNDQR